MADADAPLVGQLLANRYRAEAWIGAGGLCSVYRGRDLLRGRRVAIKVLPAAKAAVGELARRFQREITATQRIEHPNVAALYDSGTLDDGALFLVMELLPGRLLSALIDEGPVPAPRALAIARQILVGLSAAHALGVVHRDVKPTNVMLVDVDGVETVKLFDFGIAANDRAAIKLTIPGSAFGTPQYISPEMATGRAVDGRADLYSVGVTLFELVTGRLPFVSDDDLALLRAHIHEAPPSARALAPDRVSPQLDKLIARALRKSPDERFASAPAMIEAIDRLPERAAGGRRRAWLGWAAALAALGAAAAWLALHH